MHIFQISALGLSGLDLEFLYFGKIRDKNLLLKIYSFLRVVGRSGGRGGGEGQLRFLEGRGQL